MSRKEQIRLATVQNVGQEGWLHVASLASRSRSLYFVLKGRVHELGCGLFYNCFACPIMYMYEPAKASTLGAAALTATGRMTPFIRMHQIWLEVPV